MKWRSSVFRIKQGNVYVTLKWMIRTKRIMLSNWKDLHNLLISDQKKKAAESSAYTKELKNIQMKKKHLAQKKSTNLRNNLQLIPKENWFLTISILLGFEGAWKQEFFPPSATVHSVNFAAIFCGWNLMKIWMKLTDDFWKILLIRLSILSDYYLVTDLKLCEYTEVTSDSIIQNEMH
ncbi:hypothetical protein RIR_jg25511.t1 [Rhizophagus irregularis DAOM 181602=DAOM 197198]|nr:hypothetical protein RIR_jg25511.t1 [Rhizophagus irregularis DAOM 181602=DAOM 197198]